MLCAFITVQSTSKSWLHNTLLFTLNKKKYITLFTWAINNHHRACKLQPNSCIAEIILEYWACFHHLLLSRTSRCLFCLQFCSSNIYSYVLPGKILLLMFVWSFWLLCSIIFIEVVLWLFFKPCPRKFCSFYVDLNKNGNFGLWLFS